MSIPTYNGCVVHRVALVSKPERDKIVMIDNDGFVKTLEYVGPFSFTAHNHCHRFIEVGIVHNKDCHCQLKRKLWHSQTPKFGITTGCKCQYYYVNNKYFKTKLLRLFDDNARIRSKWRFKRDSVRYWLVLDE